MVALGTQREEGGIRGREGKERGGREGKGTGREGEEREGREVKDNRNVIA